MIARYREKRREAPRGWPARTPAKVEWVGVLSMLALILVLDRAANFHRPLSPYLGLIYIVAVLLVSCLAGVRAGLAAVALIAVYAWLIYRFPISAVVYKHANPNRIALNGIILYGPFALGGGLVHFIVRRAVAGLVRAEADASRESEHRQAAEAQLWASEEMRRLIVDASADAIVGLGKDGAINLWNPNAQRLFGWTREEAIGSPACKRIQTSRPYPAQNADLCRFLESGENPRLHEPFEVTVRTKTGDDVAVEVYITDHRTPAGSVFIVFARDISERSRAQQAIEDLNSKLEERVAERTKQLKDANDELLGFTYTVSHDLRAPLRAIVFNSRLACEEAEGVVGEDTMIRLRRLEANALKMSELIDNLLRYARIGHVELNSREIDLSAMANRIAADLLARGQGSITVQPGLIVQGDPEMVELVLFNLMENAWKYVRPGEPPSVEVGEGAGGVFFVRDDGIGFDMKYVGKVWEPFERLHRDAEYPGTGIGLANSKRIVERHGGRIWTESAPGKGTTMYFHLGPDAPIAAPKDRSPEASKEASLPPR